MRFVFVLMEDHLLREFPLLQQTLRSSFHDMTIGLMPACLSPAFLLRLGMGKALNLLLKRKR